MCLLKACCFVNTEASALTLRKSRAPRGGVGVGGMGGSLQPGKRESERKRERERQRKGRERKRGDGGKGAS